VQFWNWERERICHYDFWFVLKFCSSPNVSLFGGENLIDDIYPFCLSVDSLIMRLFGSASRVIFIREFEASALSHRIYNCPWQCSIGWQWTKAISFVSVCRLPLLFVAGLFPICLESEISESLHCGVCAVYPFFEFVFLTQWMSWYLIHRIICKFAFCILFCFLTVFVPTFIPPLCLLGGISIIYYSALSPLNQQVLTRSHVFKWCTPYILTMRCAYIIRDSSLC